MLDEVAGRQVAVNNRAGSSNGQVEALISHVDALLASNGNSLFTPSEEPATVIQPARCHFTYAVKLMGNIGICIDLRLLITCLGVGQCVHKQLSCRLLSMTYDGLQALKVVQSTYPFAYKRKNTNFRLFAATLLL